jgi:hypothetical protein
MKFEIGQFEYSYDWGFLGCLALAIVVVFLFSMTKFNQSTIAKDDDDLISQLLPRYLATSEQYSRALMIYLAAMSTVVVVLSLLGPRIAAMGGGTLPEAPRELPLAIALVMVGVLPNVPFLQVLEQQLRRFAHERAFIPTAARATAERLATAEFDFTSYQAEEVLGSCAMRGVEPADFAAPRDSVEYSWARLSCVLYLVRKIQNADAVSSLDSEMLSRYAQDLDNLALKRRTMQGEIEHYRQEKAADRYHTNDDLHRSIRTTLRKLYVLLGCAVRLKSTTDDAMNSAFRSFGFLLEMPMAKHDNGNIIVVGLAMMTASAFAIVYAAATLSMQNYWTPSDYFPQRITEAFSWTFSALLAHGTSIRVAEWVRRRRLARAAWFSPRQLGRRNAANYIRIASICALAGFAVIYMWSCLQTGASWNLAVGLAPYSLLWATTGAAYAVHLDNVELDARPARWQEIGLQAFVMAFCGVVVAGAARSDFDHLVLLAIFNAAIGASLAWYIPAAAARQKSDPLAEAWEQRQSILKAAARKKFKTLSAANNWLDRPNPSLDNQTPRAAVADLALFERTVSLLRGGSGVLEKRVCAANARTLRKSSAPVSEPAAAPNVRPRRPRSRRQPMAGARLKQGTQAASPGA